MKREMILQKLNEIYFKLDQLFEILDKHKLSDTRELVILHNLRTIDSNLGRLNQNTLEDINQ